MGIALSLEGDDKWWDSDQFLDDDFISRCTALLMGQNAARTGPFAADQSARPQLIRQLIVLGSGHLTSQIAYESVLHDLLLPDDGVTDAVTLDQLAHALDTAAAPSEGAAKAFALASRTIAALSSRAPLPAAERAVFRAVLARLSRRLEPAQQLALARLYPSLAWSC